MITQRELDLMRLEVEMELAEIYAEFMREFMQERLEPEYEALMQSMRPMQPPGGEGVPQA